MFESIDVKSISSLYSLLLNVYNFCFDIRVSFHGFFSVCCSKTKTKHFFVGFHECGVITIYMHVWYNIQLKMENHLYIWSCN